MTDLHCHSTCSDGTMTPAELLQLAEETGLTLFAISDHNTIRAYDSVKDPAVRSLFSGKLITASEISCILRGQLVEILGYGCDPEKLDAFLQSRKKPPVFPPRELTMIYDTYRALGVRLDLDPNGYSKEKYVSPKRMIFQQLKHPDNKKFFLDPKNQDDLMGYYWKELYNPESPLYVDYTPLNGSPIDVLNAIHEAGGKAFLAHCYNYTDIVHGHLEEIVKEFPLDGIECWYPAFTPEQSAYLEEFCETHGLLMSGGSDFHAANRPNTHLGTGIDNNLFVKEEKILPWAEEYFF